MKKIRISILLAAVLFLIWPSVGQTEVQKGRLEILGVPEEMAVGRYEPQEGIFSADVRNLPEASIAVALEGVQISGKQLEWRTKDNHLIFTEAARLLKEDFELTADVIEYFGDQEKLAARGSVVVLTADASVYSDNLEYDEKTDEALFTGEVRVVFEEGTLSGEKFLMLLEKSVLQFFGPFQGEFDIDSN